MSEIIKPGIPDKLTAKIPFKDWYQAQMAYPDGNHEKNLAEKCEAFLGNFPEHVIYNDGKKPDDYLSGDLLVIDKPAGIATDGEKPFGITDLVQIYTKNPNIFHAHRLDKWTSGVLVLGKTSQARASMQKQFEKRSEIRKTYLALVNGVWPETLGGIICPMMPNEFIPQSNITTPRQRMKVAEAEQAEATGAKRSVSGISRVAVLIDSQGYPWSILKIHIFTGRTHQIRVHTSCLGFPVMGDRNYNPDPSGAPRQMLHAFEVSLRRPNTNPQKNDRLAFQAPLPQDFQNCLSDMKIETANEEFLRQFIPSLSQQE